MTEPLTLSAWNERIALRLFGDAAAVAALRKAGSEAANDLSRGIDEDAGLLMRSNGVSVVPKSAAARRIVPVLESFRNQPLKHVPDLVSALVALPAGLADETLDALLADAAQAGAGLEGAIVDCSGHLAISAQVPVSEIAGEGEGANLGYELLAKSALGPGRYGVATSGVRQGHPTTGIADAVTVLAGDAVTAAAAAAVIADAVTAEHGAIARGSWQQGRHDPAFAEAYGETPVTLDVGILPLDLIWEALSAGVRAASALKSARLLKAAVLTVKGRGRVIGEIDPEALMRFGVSEWR